MFPQTQFVHRLFPVRYGATTAVQAGAPFLSAYNAKVAHEAIQPYQEDDFKNEYRHKGIDNPVIDLTDTASGYFVWTNTIYFRDPVVLWGLDVRMHTSTAQSHPNDFTYHADAPAQIGKANGSPVDDLYVEVSVDNPFSTEDAALHDPEVKKMRFRVDAATMGPAMGTLAAPAADFAPNLVAADWVANVWVHLGDLKIPLHRDSRVRVSLGIPQYATPALDISGWQGPAGAWEPWQSCAWSIAMTVLEPCRSR